MFIVCNKIYSYIILVNNFKRIDMIKTSNVVQGLIIKRDPEAIEITKEFVGFKWYVPGWPNTSPARINMGIRSTAGANAILCNPDFPYIFTGLEIPLAKNMVNHTADEDMIVLDVVIKKHKKKVMKTFITFHANGMISGREIIPYTSTNGKYGVEHERINIRPGDVYREGDALTRIPSDPDGKGYRDGVLLKAAFMNTNDNNEDGIVVSESAVKKQQFDYIRKFVLKANVKDIVLPINDGKPLPDIGDSLRKDQVIFSVKTPREDYKLVEYLQSSLETNEFCENTSAQIIGMLADYSEVIDIMAISQTKKTNKNVGYLDIHEQIEYYAELEENYLKSILDVHDKYVREGKSDLLSAEFRKIALDAMIRIKGPKDGRTLLMRDEKLPHYFAEVTVKFRTTPYIGAKESNRYGGKGIIVRVAPDDEMPKGVDIIIYHGAVTSRQNYGVMYDAYFQRFIETCNERVRDHINMYGNGRRAVDEAFDIIYRHIELLGVKKSIARLDAIENNHAAKTILVAAAERMEFSTLLEFDVNDINAEKVLRIEESELALKKEPIEMTVKGKKKMSKFNVSVFPVYFSLLAKSPDECMGGAACYWKPKGKPAPNVKATKYSDSFSRAAPRILSEQETILLYSWAKETEPMDIREVITRMSSPDYYNIMYYTMLDKPEDVHEKLVDRQKTKLHDLSVDRLNIILQLYGVEVVRDQQGESNGI